MTLLRKGFRERHCGWKLRYDNRRAALAARAKLIEGSRHAQRPLHSQRSLTALEAYHCRCCHYWHLGGGTPKEGDAS